ncbi:MAG: hypothetical protein ACI9KE_005521 [Polyangiales bacterium]|jgi:hypothetical protein
MNPKILKAVGAIIFVVGLTYASWFASYVPAPEEGQELPTGLARVSLWWAQVGTRFVGGILFMIIGGPLARFADKKALAAKTGNSGDGPYRGTDKGADEPGAALEGILKAIRALPVDDMKTQPQALADAIDVILTEQIPFFLDKRQELITSLGLERFAEMIGYFASMERATARAWSALTDEAFQEVLPSLQRAERGAVHATSALNGEEPGEVVAQIGSTPADHA